MEEALIKESCPQHQAEQSVIGSMIMSRELL